MWRPIFSIIILVTGLLVAAPLKAQSLVELPAPSGSFAVGRTDFTFIDPARSEPFATDFKGQREVAVRLYYPAFGQSDVSTPFATGLELDALSVLLPYPPDIISTYIRTHAVTDVAVSDAAASYPVVVFSGDMDYPTLYYTSLLEDLASHGYIVAVISHPYSTLFTVLPDGRVAFSVAAANQDTAKNAAGRDRIGAVWIADTNFVLQQLELVNTSDKRFAGRLDLQHIVIMGHGFGGGAALSGVLDRPVAGGISLDGRVFGEVAQKTLTQPFMFIDPEAGQARPAEEAALAQAIAGSTTVVYSLQVTGTDTSTFVTDDDRLSSVFNPSEPNGAKQEQSGLLHTYILAFLDKYLKNHEAPVLDTLSSDTTGVKGEIHSGR